MTKGRAQELEREIRQLELRFDERLRAIEARADAASRRADELITLFQTVLNRRPQEARSG